MANNLGQDLWYFLNMFHGLGYSVLFILGIVWLRLILLVVEHALYPRRKTPTHKFVHPLGSFRAGSIEDRENTEFQTGSSSKFVSTREKRNLCA